MKMPFAARRLFIGLSLSLAIVAPATAEMRRSCEATPEAFAELHDRVVHPRPDHIVIVAHRGCFAAASEDTPLANNACWQMGVEVVENDVRRTKDGVLVVFHDHEISRMTDRWGYVAEMTLAELRQARLKERDAGGASYSEAYLTNEPITTLEEYLIGIKNKVMVNFEIKYTSPEEFESIFDQSVIMARRLGVLDHLLFKIPDINHHGAKSNLHILEGLKLSRDIQLMPMIWESNVSVSKRLDFFERFSPVGYEIPFQHPSYFDEVRNQKRLDPFPVMTVAVQPFWSGGLDDRLGMRDPDAAWGKLIFMGADHIMTDRPEAVLRYLENQNLRRPRSCK
jgi:glycerophosphoryl diester phosphodiesterase